MKKKKVIKIIKIIFFSVAVVIILFPFISAYLSLHKMPTVKNVELKYWSILESEFGIKFPDKCKVEYASYYQTWDDDQLYIKLSIPKTQIDKFKNSFPNKSEEDKDYSPELNVNDKRIKWYILKEEDFDYSIDIHPNDNTYPIYFSKEKNGRINVFMRKFNIDHGKRDELNELFKQDKWPYFF